MKTKSTIWLGIITISVLTFNAHALLAELHSPDTSGLVSGGETWSANVTGFKVVSEVTDNGNGTWHYMYTFSEADGSPLSQHAVSHFIISISENFTLEDISNYVNLDLELGDFTPDNENENPGLPMTMYSSLKINLSDQDIVEFDCTRAPMWGDFYAKDGGTPKNYAYNTDLGVVVADPYDYTGAKDVSGAPLFKILVPDTIPEPATMVILSIGSVFLRKRK